MQWHLTRNERNRGGPPKLYINSAAPVSWRIQRGCKAKFDHASFRNPTSLPRFYQILQSLLHNLETIYVSMWSNGMNSFIYFFFFERRYEFNIDCQQYWNIFRLALKIAQSQVLTWNLNGLISFVNAFDLHGLFCKKRKKEKKNNVRWINFP